MDIACCPVHNHLLAVKPKRMVICLPNIHGVSTCQMVSNHPFSNITLSAACLFGSVILPPLLFFVIRNCPFSPGFRFMGFPLNILYTIGWLLSIPSAIKASSIRIFCHFVPMSCVSYQPLHLLHPTSESLTTQEPVQKSTEQILDQMLQELKAIRMNTEK